MIMNIPKDYLKTNRALWDHWAELHPHTEFYEESLFLSHKQSLHSIEKEHLGNLEGKDVLHLQCHFGQDTISLKTLGARRVVGLDFSEVAVQEAKKLAQKAQVYVEFIQQNVLNPIADWAGKFDVVFASYGVLGWHPKVKDWLDAAFHYLKDNGILIVTDFHPFLWTLDEDFNTFKYPYFNRDVIVEEREGSYAAPDARRLKNFTWNHTISDILSPILTEPSRELLAFEEVDWSPYALFEATERVSGRFQIKGKEGLIPLVYALKARKKHG